MMKNKASTFLKQVFSVIATIVKAKSMAVKSKTSAIKTRLLVFGLLRNKKVLMSAISHKIHALMNQDREGQGVESSSEEERNKAIVLYNAPEEAGETEYTDDDEDDDGYPDLRHTLFDLEEVESKVTTSKLSKERLDLKNGDCPLEYPWMVSTAFTKQNFETRDDEMKTVTNIPQQYFKRKVDLEDYFLEADHRLVPTKTEKVCLDIDSPFTGGNKCGPWWHISDQDELASLVAQKSLEHFENCDLPRPTQSVPISKGLFACLESLDGSKIFSSPVSCNLHTSSCNPSSYPPSSSTSGISVGKYWLSSEAGHLAKDTEKVFCTTIPSETNSSRDQLLEALCHSQTRAREAEIAAQKAYSEKEHIIKVFFKQASHLFACKQWLHMLQLESRCLQLKIKEHQLSTLFPALGCH